ncbi:hypothetical protein QCA50_020287 [Cerrena zonata]|uniref:F-box domain-containing protein n=1 Tax=Cerrena zonata TaxID=2478898 RepID=A0AAW0FF66_9APHY
MTFGVDSDSYNDGILDSESDAPNEQLLELTHYHEHEVYKHQHHIAALSRAVNSKRPVLTLSDEILVAIFLCYRDISIITGDETAGKDSQDVFDFTTWWWLVPTHICHRWRTITLASPLLWRYVDDDVFSRPHLLDTALLRSHPAPLDISIRHALFASNSFTFPDNWSKDEKESLGKILKESCRIRTFRLDMPQSLIQLQITEETHLPPFALMEELHVDALTPFGVGIRIPCILQSIPCCLCSLSLKGVIVSWEMMSNLPPTITNMQIKFPTDNPPGTCEGLLDVLTRLPNLVCLRLTKVPIGTQHAFKEVNLPRLKKLDLSQSHSWNILSVVQSLSFPPNIESTIRIKFNSDDAIPLVSLSSVFSKFGFSSLPEHAKAQHLLKYAISINKPEYGLFIETSTETCTGSWPRYFKFTLLLCNGRPATDTSPWLEFLEAASLAIYPTIKDIILDGGYQGLSRTALAGSLLRANQLECLQMNHATAATCLLEVLRVLPDGTVPVPALRRIKVWSEYALQGDSIDGAELCGVLEERLTRGYRLEEFKLYTPYYIAFGHPDIQQQLREDFNLILA